MDHKINKEIETDLVRVIGSDGKQIGILTLAEGLGLAYAEDMDLVLLSDKQTPFTCQIMDYSKYKYEQSKKQKENKRKNKAASVKEINLSYKIHQHDLDIKINQIKKFLTHKNKVNIFINFKGREKIFINKANEMLESIRDDCKGLYSECTIRQINESSVMMSIQPLR